MLAISDPAAYRDYVEKICQMAGLSSNDSYDDLLEALQKRHEFFAQMGGRLSDHGLEHIYATQFDDQAAYDAASQALAGSVPDNAAQNAYKSTLLYELAKMDHAAGWAQQFHLGALRNNNSRALRTLGPDNGLGLHRPISARRRPCRNSWTSSTRPTNWPKRYFTTSTPVITS